MRLNRVAVGDVSRTITQGSSCLATLGSGTESRWDSRTERDSASRSRFASTEMVGCFRGNIACGSAAGRGHVERRKSKDPKVPIGTTESTVSTVGCDWRMARAPAAGGATEKMGLDRCVLSSLTGLVLCSRHNPAINRWAIFERPCGTWNRDRLNTYKAQKTTLTQPLRDGYSGSATSVPRNTCQPAALA